MDVEKLVDLLIKEGVEYAEVRLQKNTEIEIIMCNGEIQAPEFTEDYGVGMRIMKDGAFAFSSTNIMEWNNVKDLGISTLKSIKSNSCKKIGLSQEEVIKKEWKANYKISPIELDIETMMELLRDIDASIKEVNIKTMNRLISFRGSIEEKVYVNSEGTRISSIVPRVSGTIAVTIYEGAKGSIQRIFQYGESGGWERIERMNLPDVAKKETEAIAKVLLEGKSPKPGVYDLIIGSEVAGIISHEGCGHPQEADRILGREGAQAGESYLKKGDLGKKIGSEVLNISDHPALENSYGFYLYDDEGVEARKKRLIVEGRINEFLHNRETAHEFKTKSNGAARASAYNREPIVRMSNTFIEPGDYSFEELIEDVKLGLYVKSFMEWNIDDLRWNHRYVGLESYLIENGELKIPIREAVIEATTQVIFSSIDAIGNDLKFNAATCGKGQPDQGVPVWTGGPSVRLRGIYIKGRS
ncbi:MAG: TldD/PmbA family protein [Candidatus Methanomethyliaceae archaeon]|nr:TldD/PmbA family protein [Candidatus Methanomethyliaceae archaeon]MDW7970732.1 TldD/PmbA family protein [Nitrososphaerota archaeon]